MQDYQILRFSAFSCQLLTMVKKIELNKEKYVFAVTSNFTAYLSQTFGQRDGNNADNLLLGKPTLLFYNLAYVR